MRRPVSTGCDTLPMIDVLEHNGKETGYEKIALWREWQRDLKEPKLTIVWIWEIAPVITASWMRQVR